MALRTSRRFESHPSEILPCAPRSRSSSNSPSIQPFDQFLNTGIVQPAGRFAEHAIEVFAADGIARVADISFGARNLTRSKWASSTMYNFSRPAGSPHGAQWKLALPPQTMDCPISLRLICVPTDGL